MGENSNGNQFWIKKMNWETAILFSNLSDISAKYLMWSIYSTFLIAFMAKLRTRHHKEDIF